MTSLYRAEVISSPREDRICTLCRTGEIDKLHLGELIYKEGISVHHFCLVSSTWVIIGFLMNERTIEEFKRFVL